jgi:ORF6N domain
MRPPLGERHEMDGQTSLIPVERIERAILSIRGEKVMLDSDLAELYGVPTKVLNQAVKRNLHRFPPDFMFQLTATEKAEVVTNCDHLIQLRFSSYLPYAFTEHGALMLANVLNSERAAQTSVQVVRAFVRLRQMLASNAELARKLAALENKYDAQFKVVFDAIRQLMSPPEPKRREIGFHVKYDEGKARAKQRL